MYFYHCLFLMNCSCDGEVRIQIRYPLQCFAGAAEEISEDSKARDRELEGRGRVRSLPPTVWQYLEYAAFSLSCAGSFFYYSHSPKNKNKIKCSHGLGT